MSTLSILDAPSTNRVVPAVVHAPAPVATPGRLTRRGRLVVVVAFLGLALALMTVFGGWAAATHDSAPPTSVSVTTVAPGDTLYDLAGRVAEPGHVRDMVRRIQDLNSLDSTTLQPGQQIAVPRG